MIVFKEINQEIKDLPDGGYLGHYPWNEFDAEDKIELKSWEPNGETMFIKMIGEAEYYFDIVF